MNHQRLAEKYKALRKEYDTLAASYRSRRSGSQRAERGTLSGEAKEITLAGGRFFVVGELWISSSVLDIPRPQGVDPLSASRYENATSESQAVIAELYQNLPPHLQEALANENRRAGFKKHVCFASSSIPQIRPDQSDSSSSN